MNFERKRVFKNLQSSSWRRFGGNFSERFDEFFGVLELSKRQDESDSIGLNAGETGEPDDFEMSGVAKANQAQIRRNSRALSHANHTMRVLVKSEKKNNRLVADLEEALEQNESRLGILLAPDVLAEQRRRDRQCHTGFPI